MSGDPLAYLSRTGELTDVEADAELVVALTSLAARCRTDSLVAPAYEEAAACLMRWWVPATSPSTMTRKVSSGGPVGRR
jgi:hypothetical protein